MQWSPRVLSVWGKSDIETLRWMPVVRHLEDSAAVAGWLWDQWLPASVRHTVARSLPGGDQDGRILLTWLAGVHDIGKVSPGFAVKITQVGPHSRDFQGVLDDMAVHGLAVAPKVTKDREPPHCAVGQFLLTQWLTKEFAASDGPQGDRRAATRLRRTAVSIAGPVGAHHGVPAGSLLLNSLAAHPGVGLRHPAWCDAQAEVLSGMAEATGAGDRIEAWLRAPLPMPTQILLAGAVVVADWLASDSDRFPYDDPRTSGERAKAAVTEWDLPRPWTPALSDADPQTLFKERFPSLRGDRIRPIQRAAVDAARSAHQAPLMVIEAGTGDGKTEAALMAAEVLASRFGQGGVVFALPTQATSDGVFRRIQSWVDNLPDIGRTSIFLAHGKAALNDDYRGLIRAGRIVGIEGEATGEAAGMANAVVTSWLRGRRKGMLADFVIGTIDQVLFGALKARHLPMRHLALAGKVVIIDEVHAADTYMRVYLCRVLEWLGSFGTPVILLSATLPSHIREELVDAYRAGAGFPGGAGSPRPDTYPRLTVIAGGSTSYAVEATTEPGREVHLVAAQGADDTAWLAEVAQAVEAGACVAVVRNTVGRAQESYASLCEALGPHRTRLLHSRFLAVHRMSKEQEVRDMLGPGPRGGAQGARPDGLVVVGTQVLEQSLDIDVDLMVSDIAPIDLVLQRIGRLHRHRRPHAQRPALARRARCLVICPRGHADVPDVSPADENIYGSALILRALAVLAPKLAGEPLRIPSDVPHLVEEAYAADLVVPSSWEPALRETDHAHAVAVTEQRARAGAFVLDPPGTSSNLVDWLSAGTDEPDDDAPRSRARVRDTEDSVDVIVVRRVDGAVRPLAGVGTDETVTLPTELGPPSDGVARRLSGCTVSLPRMFTHSWTIDRVIADLERQGAEFTGWQQSPWLKGELVLVLSDGASVPVAGWTLSYDPVLGLTQQRMTDGARP